MLEKAVERKEGATIFGYYVKNPSAYGVVEFDKDNKVISIEEKPKNPKSNYAVPGLYFYDNTVVNIAKNLKPSKRGELEITDLNMEYLNKGKLKVELFGRGMAWLDTGTHTDLLKASNFVQAIQERQGLYIACLEEIALKNGFITKDHLKNYIIENKLNNEYGNYVVNLLEDFDK
jgi:glucose-1-phosphate thymidylyltransferase